ncbi:MAG: T9SS type A sorting domain-containing protein [Flavobacteriales bacterium]|nr:T9SS type A sorting domain-containing protein [Flavobacteriales bacterium]
MKKVLLLLLLVTGLSNAQIVNIPDANFKAKLLQADVNNEIAYNNNNNIKIDVNNDGEIQLSEALTVTNLNISSSNISDLTGLASFSNLDGFNCSNNLITQIDVVGQQNLLYLDVRGNNLLTSVNVSGLTNLITLLVNQNPQLISINASNCSSLQGLTLTNGNLSTLNISGCTSLLDLLLDNNNLTSLDVSGLVNLTYINCNYNQISNLNVTGCVSLEYIDLDYNLLTELNVISLPSLLAIEAKYNLISVLNLVDLPNLAFLYIEENPTPFIDVSNLPSLYDFNFGSVFTPIEWLNMKNGSHTSLGLVGPGLTIHNTCCDESELVYFTDVFTLTNPPTTYCTFTPGPNYNTITGTVTFDQNSDGCDSNDLPMGFVKINMIDGSSTPRSTFSQVDGSFVFFTLAGNFTLTPQLENPSWFSFSPSSATVSFSTVNNTSTQNFCLTPVGIHNDVEVIIVPSTARPGFDATYQIIYRNKGNQALSGTVEFTYEDDVLDYVSATQSPDVQNTGSLTWNFTNLLPFEVRSVTVTLNVNSPTETPAVNIGDELDFATTINPISGDETPLDNVFGLKQVVVGSFDPNDKTCLEGSVVSTSKIGDYLHYNINFENTGTFPATFVVVKDMIDAAKFDVSTLQVLNASHPMETRVAGNKVEFIFDDINLGPNQHGNVVFKIKTKSTLVEGNTVTNNANIYFDYNFPIETNTTSTTFQTLSNGEFPTDYSVVIAPNPTKNNVNINCNNTIRSIQLFDVQGRILMTQLANNSQSIVDVSNYANGIYFVKVTTEIGALIERIIKE